MWLHMHCGWSHADLKRCWKQHFSFTTGPFRAERRLALVFPFFVSIVFLFLFLYLFLDFFSFLNAFPLLSVKLLPLFPCHTHYDITHSQEVRKCSTQQWPKSAQVPFMHTEGHRVTCSYWHEHKTLLGENTATHMPAQTLEKTQKMSVCTIWGFGRNTKQRFQPSRSQPTNCRNQCTCCNPGVSVHQGFGICVSQYTHRSDRTCLVSLKVHCRHGDAKINLASPNPASEALRCRSTGRHGGSCPRSPQTPPKATMPLRWWRSCRGDSGTHTHTHTHTL